jgi:DNA polymerase-3 subunit epsilon
LNALRALADEHGLCLQTLGFDSPVRPGACWRLQLGRCAGVCAGKESIHVHHGRVAEALARLKAIDWPHRGPVGIVERDRRREATEVHVVDRWCYMGSAASDAELAEVLDGARLPSFDYDQYRILARHLARKGVRTMQLASKCTVN